MRFLSLGCVALLLAACGGGEGGGPRTVGNFTITTSTVTFDAEVGGPSPAPATVTGSITGVEETVFLTVVLTSNGLANASVAVTGETTGALTIFPKHPAQLGSASSPVIGDSVLKFALDPTGVAAPTFSSARRHQRPPSRSAPGNPFPKLPPIDVPFGASAMGISLNGEQVFIMSTGTFFVVEP